eukprot:978094-Rhodomonas_salina.2
MRSPVLKKGMVLWLCGAEIGYGVGQCAMVLCGTVLCATDLCYGAMQVYAHICEHSACMREVPHLPPTYCYLPPPLPTATYHLSYPTYCHLPPPLPTATYHLPYLLLPTTSPTYCYLLLQTCPPTNDFTPTLLPTTTCLTPYQLLPTVPCLPCYGMSDTLLRVSYGVSGTDFGYAPTRSSKWSAPQVSRAPIYAGDAAIYGGNTAVYAGATALYGGGAAILGGDAAIYGFCAAVYGNAAAVYGDAAAIYAGTAALFGAAVYGGTTSMYRVCATTYRSCAPLHRVLASVYGVYASMCGVYAAIFGGGPDVGHWGGGRRGEAAEHAHRARRAARGSEYLLRVVDSVSLLRGPGTVGTERAHGDTTDSTEARVDQDHAPTAGEPTDLAYGAMGCAGDAMCGTGIAYGATSYPGLAETRPGRDMAYGSRDWHRIGYDPIAPAMVGLEKLFRSYALRKEAKFRSLFRYQPTRCPRMVLRAYKRAVCDERYEHPVPPSRRLGVSAYAMSSTALEHAYVFATRCPVLT